MLLSKKFRIVLMIMMLALKALGQNCDVNFPGTANRTFSGSCGTSTGNLTLGKDTYMGNGDVFTFDVSAQISGNVSVNAQGSGKIVIASGVTVTIDGNFQLDSKNSGCRSGSPCIFEIEVNGTLIVDQNFQNNILSVVWSGSGTVVFDDKFENSSNGCMRCANGGCPAFQGNTGNCSDKGGSCSGGDFCTEITACLNDNIAPVIANCPANRNVNLGSSCQVTVNWTAPTVTDNCSGATLTSTHAPGSSFTRGTTKVTYTAKDAAGNTSTCSFDITVADNSAPALTNCPSNITRNTTSSCEAIADWTAPGVTDNCAGATLTTTHPPGSAFSRGTTTVTYTARDAAGNTATCSFNVTVVDNVAPVLTNCPSNITLSTTSSCAALATWTPPSLSDNCLGATLTSTHTPGSSFIRGTTKVTYTARDAAGNTATCSFDVTVTESGPSLSACPTDITMTAGPSCDAVVTWAPPLASGCIAPQLTSTHRPGDRFEVGTTEVTYTATDVIGRIASCRFNVIVQAPLPALTNCPVDLTIQADQSGTAHPTWTPPTLRTACSTAELVSSHSPGDPFAIGTTRVTYSADDNLGRQVLCQFNVQVTMPEVKLEIGRIVTPDGDGINDIFEIKDIQKFQSNQVTILDRWGGVVFEGRNYNNASTVWAGENKSGRPVPTGTYFFRISVVVAKEEFTQTGFLELIR